MKINLSLTTWSRITIILFGLCGSAIGRESSNVCDEFRKLTSVRGGLTAYELEAIPTQDAKKRIPNVDIDGDGISDDIIWFCPGSGSLVPADPCTVSVALSTGKKIEFQQPRFYLVRVRSRIYAVSIEMKENNTPSKTTIFQVDKTGFKQVCPKP